MLNKLSIKVSKHLSSKHKSEHNYYNLLKEIIEVYNNSFDLDTINRATNLIDLLTISQNKNYIDVIENIFINKTGLKVNLNSEQFNICRQADLEETIYNIQDVEMFSDDGNINYYDLKEIGDNIFYHNIYNISKVSGNHSENIGKGELLLALNGLQSYKSDIAFSDLIIDNKLIEVKTKNARINYNKDINKKLHDILIKSDSYRIIDCLNLLTRELDMIDEVSKIMKQYSIHTIVSSLVLSILKYDSLDYIYLYNTDKYNKLLSAVSIPIGKSFEFYLEGFNMVEDKQPIKIKFNKSSIKCTR